MLEILYQKKFLKDLSAIPAKYRKEIEHFVFAILPVSENLAGLKKFEKMSGYENYYKARFSNYRIGAHYENNRLELKRVLHRKEIYRYFP